MESKSQASISRKPVNVTSALSSNFSLSSHGGSTSAAHSSTTHPRVLPSANNDSDTITISRAAIGQLVDALAASVSLLQASLVDNEHARSNLEASGAHSTESDQLAVTPDHAAEYVPVQLLSASRKRHRKDLLEQVFRQGSGPWFFEEYVSLYGVDPFVAPMSSQENDRETMGSLRHYLWELLIGHQRLPYQPVLQSQSHLAAVRASEALLDVLSNRPYPLSQPVTRRSTVKFNEIALFLDVLSIKLGLGTFSDETPDQVEHRLRVLVAICQANEVYTNCGCVRDHDTRNCRIQDYSQETDCNIWSGMTVGAILAAIYEQGLMIEPGPSDLAGHRRNAARILQSLYPLRFFISHFDWVDHLSSKDICPTATSPIEIMQMRVNDLALVARKPRELHWVRAIGTQFAIKLINVENLQFIGGIYVQWTDNLYEHLELSFENYPVLKIYWFAWATLDLPFSRIGSFTSTTREELLSTYQLLFGVSPPGFLRTQSQRPVRLYNKVETHPNIARRFPQGKAPLELEGDIVTKQGRPYDFGADYHLPVEETHVSSLGTTASQQDMYEKYPSFEDNLRILVAYMDSQKPGGLRGLWYDKRDSGAWYTFWAVLWIGGISLLIGFLSLIASITQSVASFQSLASDPVLLKNGTVFVLSEANVTRTIEVFIPKPAPPSSTTSSSTTGLARRELGPTSV